MPTKSGLMHSHNSDLDMKIPRAKMPKRALPDCLRKKKMPQAGSDSSLYQPGAGVLIPRGSEDGQYRAGSQRNFLKRRSGKPMSERASRLAQMKMGEGYSRGQVLTEKTKAAAAKDAARERARQRQRQGNMIIGSNQGKSPSASLPDGWTKHKDDSGRTYYCNRSTGQTQWNPPVSDTNDWSSSRAQAAEVGRRQKRTETPVDEGYDRYEEEDDSDSDHLMALKKKTDATEAHVNRLQDKEEQLIKALEQVRIKKDEAQRLLKDQQTAYEEALSEL